MLIWQVEKYTMLQHTLILFEILINYFFLHFGKNGAIFLTPNQSNFGAETPFADFPRQLKE
jgi:hypothetical protein